MAYVIDNKPSDEVRAALFEKLTERLRNQGFAHPEAAAVALAARGDARLTIEDMAVHLDVALDWLCSVEEGHVALADLEVALFES